MAIFTAGFRDNHLLVFNETATDRQVEKMIDDAVARLNNRTVRTNSLIIVSTAQEQQILAHCDMLNRNTRETDVVYNTATVQFGLVANRTFDRVDVYEQVTFGYKWGWGRVRNLRQIFHFGGVKTYLTFRKSIRKSLVEDFPAL